MTEANVVYSDVTFTKSDRNVSAPSPPAPETTYSDIRTVKTESSTDPPDSKQRRASHGGSKFTLEKIAIAMLSTLLAAAIAGLIYTSYGNFRTTEHLQQLMAVNKNLSEKTCDVKPCHQDTICLDFSQYLSTKTCPKCQEGWEQWGRQCYYFSNDTFSWDEARGQCQRKGGDLVQIDGENKQLFLVKHLSVKMKSPEIKFWIGLTDSEMEGVWLWVDGSPLNSSLDLWAAINQGKEPDNWMGQDPDGEDCVRMGERGNSVSTKIWFDQSCKSKQRYICEIQALDIGVLKCF
ncbi:C-type lectin domain family 4 member E-like isoform X2 [Antennarius striatus]|uniref:C-type lectin domain family 4 member E-like isoform X2 n=1 Tax=Antennarius striatus TaxID=241820 RepID=UPI0035B1B72E